MLLTSAGGQAPHLFIYPFDRWHFECNFVLKVRNLFHLQAKLRKIIDSKLRPFYKLC